MLTVERLIELLERFTRLRIGLVGDLFLDRYLDIEPEVCELSVETELEAYQVTRVRNAAGALGTVLNNLVAMGVAKLMPVAVIGDDGHGDDLMRRLRNPAVDVGGVVRSPQRLTPTYTKPMKQDSEGVWRELNRLDIRDRKPLSAVEEGELLSRLDTMLAEADGLIVLDQIVESDWGVVNARVRQRLREFSAERPEFLIFVDSRRHLRHFDFGVVKCNREELLMAHQSLGGGEDRVEVAAAAFASRSGKPAFCTLGAEGILVANAAGRRQRIAGCRVSEPTDIVGAGDAASAAIVATLLSGGSEAEAAFMGNLAASITVKKIGETGSASSVELKARLVELSR